MNDIIKCPACGAEVEMGTENCPSCGAPVGVINEENIAGVPIDNHAAIDNMLRSASRLVDESQSLGIGNIEGSNSDDEEETEEYKRVKLTELPPELSDTQKKEIKSGGVVNLSPDEKGAAAVPASNAAGVPASAPSGSGGGSNVLSGLDLGIPSSGSDAGLDNAPGVTLFEMDEDGNVIEPEEEENKKGKKQKEKKPKKEKTTRERHYKAQHEINPKDKKKKGSPASALLAAVIALAVGLAGGFFGKMFFFPELPSPSCQDFAEKAVKSVNQIKGTNENIFVLEAYVKDFTTSRQCIFRALSEKDSVAECKWYRVKIDNDNQQTINIYMQLNQEEYESLKNSEDKEEQIRASVLMSIQNETDRCIEEMQSGMGWEAANSALLNNAINPYIPTLATSE